MEKLAHSKDDVDTKQQSKNTKTQDTDAHRPLGEGLGVRE